MICYYHSDEIAALDQKLFDLGVNGSVLMENVGREIAEQIAVEFPFSGGLCVVCAGPGNNGGDGFVIARHLALRGWKAVTVLSHPRERSRGAAAENLKLLELCSLPTLSGAEKSDEELAQLFSEADVIVDALLGTGAAGNPRGETGRLIELINQSGAVRISVDLPSGIESGGAVCVNARRTFTAAARKTVMATGPGAWRSGQVSVVSLGVKVEQFLPPPSVREPEEADFRAWMPKRGISDHKGSRGGVLIVAGSLRYPGAALLAARGALRTGAGLVALAAPEKVLAAAAVELPEIIGEPLDDPARLPDVLEHWQKRCPVLLAGPGLDRDQRAERIYEILKSWRSSRISVWDGDGLFWIAQRGKPGGSFCMTPHEGEAGRLLGLDPMDIAADRLSSVRALADAFGPVTLKGYRSLTAVPGGIPLVIGAGDRTLSIPGSGDVLSGVTAALLAAGLSEEQALALAAWAHGRAGERLGETQGHDGVLASEVADAVPRVLKELNSSCES